MSPRETPAPLFVRGSSPRTEDDSDNDNDNDIHGGSINVDGNTYSGPGGEEVRFERTDDVDMDREIGMDGHEEEVEERAGGEQVYTAESQDQSADTGSGGGIGIGANENTAMRNGDDDGNENEEMGPPAFNSQTWVDFIRDSPVPPSRQQNRENPLPPLPTESRNTYSSPFPQQYHPQYPAPLYADYGDSARTSLPSISASSSRNPLPPLPSQERRDSNDRKRRLTTGESPHRRGSGMRASSSGNIHGDEALTMDPRMLHSSSASTPIPSGPSTSSGPSYGGMRPPMLPPRGSQGSGMRRESDLVLPPWQPDSEVSHCFVCGSQFTFFYRKHHCRKCGRVVCAACSPHRITIPRQFIVHPPNENTNIIDLTGDDDENPLSAFGPFRNPALGGGEEVRVCNPCVPDPNYSPPPPYAPMQPQSPYRSQFSPPAQHPAQSHSLLRGGHRPSQSLNDGSQTAAGHDYAQSRPPRDPFSDRRTSYHDSTRVADLWPPQLQQQSQQPHYPYDQRPHSHSRPHPITSSTMPAPSQPNNRHSMGPNMFRRGFIPGTNTPIPSSRPHHQHHHHQQQQQQAPPPRRQIPEEDECPICGNELPPKGPDDDEAERIKHVEECIALHSSSPAPAPSSSLPLSTQTSTSLPSQRTRGMSNAAGLAAGSNNNSGTPTPQDETGNGEGTSSGTPAARNRNRMSMNMSARGMLVYTATEKDCVDDEGEEAECVICFEEVVVGVKLARLVCFCKFHETCIRQWWDMKGRGACPTHQLHD